MDWETGNHHAPNQCKRLRHRGNRGHSYALYPAAEYIADAACETFVKKFRNIAEIYDDSSLKKILVRVLHESVRHTTGS